MSVDNFSRTFLEFQPKYEKLGLNAQQTLETFLTEKNIPYLSIKYRVKEQASFLEKIERKKYKNPFDEIEDICGIRVICYFQNDIEKIKDIILKEFDITENQTKQELLNATEFGYRSTHFIAKIKKEWTNAPNYRGLDNLKFEIQVRTILMHSWAEIEHKLAYKSEIDIPKDLRRKFSFISAVLEDADIKFEEIKNTIAENKFKLIKEAKDNLKFDASVELNLDNLQAFLDYAFENRFKNIFDTREFLNEMVYYETSFMQFIDGYYKYKDSLPLIERETMEEIKFKNDPLLWSQCGAARTILELINDNYFKERQENPNMDIIKKYRNN
ncbi:(p)ppGpp synthetase [Acinetobacter tandoii]|nr:(p)ppGpp synthetase [Acinetobacter tandoii]